MVVVVVGPAAMRVLAVSDLHVDYVKNLEWCKSLSDEEYAEDCLIVAGDISHKMDKLEETLRTLKQKFKEVFFTPGNHDLWVTDAKGAKDSIEKMKEVEELCGRLNVATRAKKITFGVSIFAILSCFFPFFLYYLTFFHFFHRTSATVCG